MDLGLTDRRVLIVGARTDVAAACAEALAREGAFVMMDRTSFSASAPVAAPLAHEFREQPLALAEEALGVRGGVDIVVAALAEFTSELSLVDWVDDNMISAWDDIASLAVLYQAFVASMKERGFGRFIWIGPIEAKWLTSIGGDLDTIVGMGALGMHKTIAGELGSVGITANSVLWRVQEHPDGRCLEAIGATAAYLSSRAAAYTTGSVIALDDGLFPGIF